MRGERAEDRGERAKEGWIMGFGIFHTLHFDLFRKIYSLKCLCSSTHLPTYLVNHSHDTTATTRTRWRGEYDTLHMARRRMASRKETLLRTSNSILLSAMCHLGGQEAFSNARFHNVHSLVCQSAHNRR